LLPAGVQSNSEGVGSSLFCFEKRMNFSITIRLGK
jgi:hypothetical protein